jgi:drug/metabolite transporter (DMT)-like permease
MLSGKYRGIIFMILAALGFSIMGAAAKMLKGELNAGQLTFYRNVVGLIFLIISCIIKPPITIGNKTGWLVFRGLMGTTALYTLLYCILYLPLGTAMSYNLSSTLFIAILSFLVFKEKLGKFIWGAVLLGFVGMGLIYQPSMNFPWYYHVAGLISGLTSAIAYLTVGRLTKHYDSRIIVAAFVVIGTIIPVLGMLLKWTFRLPSDEILFIEFILPTSSTWLPILLMGTAALLGQYFVTLAYGSDKAGIVSVFSYSNIIFSVFLGVLLGDAFPNIVAWTGIACIIGSGILISLEKRKQIIT